MVTRTLIALLALTASCALAQQYSGNYVDGGDYDYQDQGQALPPPRPAPAPIQRSIRPNPPQQSLRNVGPATQRTPPVAILKQINRHNDDGSYTYGFEGADGSFKIETKLATGEVMGKYGYVDDTGKVRTVEYGANKYGFQPVGEGITVAPPTYIDESRRAKGDQAPDYDDGQYYEEVPAAQPRARPQPQPQRPRPAPRPKAAPLGFQQPQPQPQGQVIYQQQQQQQQQHQQQHQHAPIPRVSQGFGPEPPRAQISGAAPAPAEHQYRPQPPPQRSFPAPPPQNTQARFIPPPPQQRSFSQPPPRSFPSQPAPVHQFEQHGPPAPQHHFAPRPASQARQGGGSYFDQLTKDYALPTGGTSNPIHDIAFGSQY